MHVQDLRSFMNLKFHCIPLYFIIFHLLLLSSTAHIFLIAPIPSSFYLSFSLSLNKILLIFLSTFLAITQYSQNPSILTKFSKLHNLQLFIFLSFVIFYKNSFKSCLALYLVPPFPFVNVNLSSKVFTTKGYLLNSSIQSFSSAGLLVSFNSCKIESDDNVEKVVFSLGDTVLQITGYLMKRFKNGLCFISFEDISSSDKEAVQQYIFNHLQKSFKELLKSL